MWFCSFFGGFQGRTFTVESSRERGDSGVVEVVRPDDRHEEGELLQARDFESKMFAVLL